MGRGEAPRQLSSAGLRVRVGSRAATDKDVGRAPDLDRGQNAGARRPRQTLDTLLPSDTPPEALDLLRRLLVFAPDKRLSAAQALQHPYVQR